MLKNNQKHKAGFKRNRLAITYFIINKFLIL